MHGQSKVVRDINFFFGTTLPADANKNVYVWLEMNGVQMKIQ